MSHEACLRDGNSQRTLAVQTVRGWRLVLSFLHHDSDAVNVVVEIEACPDCLQALVYFLASFLAEKLIDQAGHELAVRNVERCLADAIRSCPT